MAVKRKILMKREYEDGFGFQAELFEHNAEWASGIAIQVIQTGGLPSATVHLGYSEMDQLARAWLRFRIGSDD